MILAIHDKLIAVLYTKGHLTNIYAISRLKIVKNFKHIFVFSKINSPRQGLNMNQSGEMSKIKYLLIYTLLANCVESLLQRVCFVVFKQRQFCQTTSCQPNFYTHGKHIYIYEHIFYVSKIWRA